MGTTGGGWQDQVGGLIGGFKLAESAASLPLEVSVQRLQSPEGFLQAVGAHTILIYTGRTRLAKDILQNVIWRWYARVSETILTLKGLKANAFSSAHAIEEGSIEEMGHCLHEYWEQKKRMSPG